MLPEEGPLEKIKQKPYTVPLLDAFILGKHNKARNMRIPHIPPTIKI